MISHTVSTVTHTLVLMQLINNTTKHIRLLVLYGLCFPAALVIDRDNVSTSDPDIEDRRHLFEDIFTHLETAGN